LLQQGHNVLVFQPGKSEISALINDLKIISGLAAELLPLHGELSPEEQTACFKHYGRPKCVVSTNVAQTSVTIDDIDAVVDSGMERRIELVNGVEGLYLKPISFADAKQRKGRAGRTKAGVYIDHCPTDEKRLDFPKAEILRSHLDQTVLRLAEAGFDAEELDFFHQPNKTEIHEAKRALKALGCMDESGKVSAIGSRVAKMPVSVQYARMVVEAERLGVVDDVITVAAILEQGEITARKVRTTDGREVEARPYWLPLTNGEQESDVLAQLAIYKAALNMTKDELQKNGVFTKGFFQAKEVRRHLAESLRGKVREFRSSGKREDIMRALCAGMVDHLYQNNYGNYRNGDGVSRQLNRESVIREAGWLVGLPWDLQITTRRGTMTLQLIRMATKVNPMWLTEVAPQLVKKIDGLRPMFYPAKDSVVSTTEILFQGRQISNETISDPENPLAAEIFCKWLSAQMAI
jgi:ATP-dependent helicase HrpB